MILQNVLSLLGQWSLMLSKTMSNLATCHLCELHCTAESSFDRCEPELEPTSRVIAVHIKVL